MSQWRPAVVACLVAAGLSVPHAAGATVPYAAAEPASGDSLRLSIQGAVELAIRQGEPAAVLREEIRIAQAERGVVLSNALPKIRLDARYNRNLKRPVLFFPDEDGIIQSIELGEDNEYSATLSLRQPIFSSGRLGAAYKASRHWAEAAELAGEAAAAEIALAVKEAYFSVLLLGAQTRIAAQSLRQAERRREEIRDRVERGVAPRFDLLRADVEVANRGPVLTAARYQVLVSKQVLKRSVGLPLDRPLVLVDSLRYVPVPLTREQATEEALAQRPDLAAARREAQAVAYRRKAQAANDLPLLYLDGNYTWQGQTSRGLVPGDRETAQSAALGFTLTWPILDGLENRNRTRQAEAELERAKLRARQLEEEIRLEARTLWTTIRALEEELLGVEESVLLATEALDIAETRFRRGLSTQIEVLDADLALTQSRLARTEVLYRYRVALAELERILGRGPSLSPEGEDR
jgi:outer membrane protein TolC